jgi:hypothetical protein
MKLLTFILLASLTAGMQLRAQTLNQNNVAPENGIYNVLAGQTSEVPWTSLDSAGTAVQWDITDFIWEYTEIVQYEVADAATSPYIDEFPDANVYIMDFMGGPPTLHRYLRVEENGLEDLGLAADIPDLGLFVEDTCPALLLGLPAEAGTTTYPEILDCPFTFALHSERKVLAFGELITSTGTMTDVVLIRRSVAYEDWLGGKGKAGEVYWDHVYEWYKVGNLVYPVLSVGYNPLSNTFEYASALLPTTTDGLVEQSVPVLSLFPNPANSMVTLYREDGRPLGEVSIYCADGRLIRREEVRASRTLVDVQGLAPGLYHAACTGFGAHLRFVKE